MASQMINLRCYRRADGVDCPRWSGRGYKGCRCWKHQERGWRRAGKALGRDPAPCRPRPRFRLSAWPAARARHDPGKHDRCGEGDGRSSGLDPDVCADRFVKDWRGMAQVRPGWSARSFWTSRGSRT